MRRYISSKVLHILALEFIFGACKQRKKIKQKYDGH